MVSSCRNSGTISQELRYPFAGTAVQLRQESSNKYEFEIKELNFDVAKSSNNCLFLLFSYLYYEKKKDKAVVKFFKDYARSLVATEMDNYWLFIYEALSQSDLQDYWKAMKKNNVSFIVEM